MNYHRFLTTLALAGLALGCGHMDVATNADPDGDLGEAPAGALAYPINGTAQTTCYDNNGEAACPSTGAAFHGQDAQRAGRKMRFRDNGDGTVSDLNTGLMWVKEQGSKMTWSAAKAGAKSFSLAGHRDWRLPGIKELYSLMDFTGYYGGSLSSAKPYIDTKAFGFQWGDTSAGERVMDVQYCSSTEYVGSTMNGDHTVFGVNFADGRIKGYGTNPPHGAKKFAVKYVRGNPKYGRNALVDNGDGTINDRATGLVWSKAESSKTLNWQQALAHCQALTTAGHTDWRLPDAKELQSIVDYRRAPAVTGTAAIDPVFKITNKESFFWTSTTHLDGPADIKGSRAVYVAFGRATGYMQMPPGSGPYRLLDVHGAGAQRSDPKAGDPKAWPNGHGPQGDVIRIYNYARCVRGG